jgi:N6-adenosine-specific RNA methylase IME4
MPKFDVLVCDPPWSYDRKTTGGTNLSGSLQQYTTLTKQELANLDIINLMEDDSVCFLWTTVPMLPDAIQVLAYWGFEYKTMITWIKKNYGLGNYFRGKTEHLLMGMRGKVKPFGLQVPNLIISEKTLKHSQKPEESYKLIDKCGLMMSLVNMKQVNILELFAREKRQNWVCIGREVTGNDITADIRVLQRKYI